MHIVVSGGGTGGHIAPILAVVETLRRFEPAAKITFIGSGAELERSAIDHAGIKYLAISSGKYRRYGRGTLRELGDVATTHKNVSDLFRFGRGWLQARRLLRQLKPDVVFTKGGYVGLPVGLAAKKLRIPLIIHESDSVMGRANQILAGHASIIATGFPLQCYSNVIQKVPARKEYVGVPIRADILNATGESAEKFFPFSANLPVVMIFGGSQGAQSLNTVIFENLESICKKYNIIHLTGERDIGRARFVAHHLPKDLQGNYMPHSFLKSEMGQAYKRADIVVGRGGMTALTEIAAWSKPAIIVPLPSSANDHQAQNARLLVRAGAIRLLPQAELKELKLMAEIDRLMADRPGQEYLSKTIHKFYKPDAADHLAKLIHQLAEEKP